MHLFSSETETSVSADGTVKPDGLLYIKTLMSFKPLSPISESVIRGGGCGCIGVGCKKTSKCWLWGVQISCQCQPFRSHGFTLGGTGLLVPTSAAAEPSSAGSLLSFFSHLTEL